ncbi:MAG: GGDEF domain-containing protein [bacterium]
MSSSGSKEKLKRRLSEEAEKFVADTAQEGTVDSQNMKALRNAVLIKLFNVFAALFFLILAVPALLREEYLVSAVFFLGSFLSLLNMVLFRIFNNFSFSSGFLIVLLNMTAVYAIVFGGIEDTGILMAFILPPVFIFLRGSKTGGILVLIMTAIALSIFFFIDPALVFPQYSVPVKVVFIVCFVFLSIFSFFHELSREYVEKKLETVANHDPLTGLLNRREMEKMIRSESARSLRYSNPLSLMICDIDNFKEVNDTYGHKFGDEVLKAIAEIFVKNTRSHESICRWGGEEFVILLPETPVAGCMVVAERLREKVAENKIMFGKDEISVTMSFGIGGYSPEQSIEENIDNVDKAMYRAKKAGKNCIKKVTVRKQVFKGDTL